MDASFWAIVLLTISLTLFFAELFIPSGGLILLTAVICAASAIWNAYSAWWSSNPPLFWAFVFTTLILIPSSIYLAISLWPKTSIGKRSEPPTLEEVTPYLEEQRRLELLVGQIGLTDTPLNPGGIVRIKDQRYHCRSEGMIVSRDTPVVVLSVVGNGLLVREAPKSASPPAGTQSAENSSGKSPEKSPGETLDFDLPET